MTPDPVVLQSCLLFQGKSTDEIQALLEPLQYTVKSCNKNELIISEGETADRLGIVLSGPVEIHKMFNNGNSVTITRLGEGQTFGEAVLFRKDNIFPATVIAPDPCLVMFIGKQALLKLFAADTDILSRYMENISERLVMVNRRIEILSAGTLRRRIVFYLLEQAGRQSSDIVKLPFGRRAWAEHLNTTRPSLSREISYLRDKGWIYFRGSIITLLERKQMKDWLGMNE